MTGPHFLAELDCLDAVRFSALGDFPVIVGDAESWPAQTNGQQSALQTVFIGVDATGALPAIDPRLFDVLVTTATAAPAPWVSVTPEKLQMHLQGLAAAVQAFPIASSILCRTLRLSEALPVEAALDVESLAYSTLLGGAEFGRWRQQTALQPVPRSDGPPVLIDRQDDHITLTLHNPAARNAMTAAMRDALHEALAAVADDPTLPTVTLRGAGRCFSTGGALGEFGSATDLAQAHVVRTVRSCAGLLFKLGARASAHLHGGCVGSGLEVPAAAAYRRATPDTWFQLPELRMGLIPGAGGTASVARAIGRHRTAWLVLTGKRIDARQALDWGLVHEIAP